MSTSAIAGIQCSRLNYRIIELVVAAVTKLTEHKLILNNALLTVLGTVLGLVVSTCILCYSRVHIFTAYLDQFPDIIRIRAISGRTEIMDDHLAYFKESCSDCKKT